MLKKYLFLFIILFTFFQANLQAQGYKIRVKIDELPNQEIILGHHFSTSLFPDDTITLNTKGEGVFKGKEPLTGGMYFIFLPNKKYFDILVGEDQEFTIENDTVNFIDNFQSGGSLENELFYEYQRFLQARRNETAQIRQKIENATGAEKEKLEEELEEINKAVSSYQETIREKHPGTFFAAFLTALKEVEVPEPPRDDEGNVIDSLFQYNYYKAHYFDNFPLSDPRLLRTPLYEKKIKTYIEKVIPQVPDSIIVYTDKLIEASRGDEETFRYVLGTIYNHFGSSQIMGMDAVFVHVAEKYYIPEATWSDSAFIAKLKTEVAKKKPLLLGNVAPNVQLVEVPADHFKEAAENKEMAKDPYVGSYVQLHDIEAKYLIIVFWEADCGHCKKSLPVLYETARKLKDKGVKLLSVHMLGGGEGKEKWTEFLDKHQFYDMIHAWNPYDYTFKKKFDVYSSPTIFILDGEKRIVAKRIGAEQVEEIISVYSRKQF